MIKKLLIVKNSLECILSLYLATNVIESSDSITEA